VAAIAAAIGEPARARMLYVLLDDRARTSTELALVAGVGPSTASAHLARLKQQRLVLVLVQGKHRYYRLAGAGVARVLEELSVLAGGARASFTPNTPNELRAARTCYDHIAGSLGVLLHDRLVHLKWTSAEAGDSLELTPKGTIALEKLGVDVARARASRRRFAFACLDWSERRPHLGGALGAAVYALTIKKRWVSQPRGSRILNVSAIGRRELRSVFEIRV